MVDFGQMITKKAQVNIDTHYTIATDQPWLAVLSQTPFQTAVSETIKAGDFSARALLKVLNRFAPTPFDEEQWLNDIYQYSLSLSYPSNATVPTREGFSEHAIVFLELFRLVNDCEKKLAKGTFYYDYPFELLSEDEITQLEDDREYQIVLTAFRFDYIYQMMKLNREIFPYSTIEHITGVHHLAMFIARQVKAAGIPVDLGIVSGAAALHDLGKFGCRPDEGAKVAYYHYYYSEEWFYRKDIRYIRNIAVNHSTWDLELESLSVESLILIYSDFRVKAHDDPNWPYPMKFYDIQSSFDVILQKLDNVDAAKELRYRKVYTKLADFERFLTDHGIATAFDKPADKMFTKPTDCVFMDVRAIVMHFKQLSIAHSLQLMYQLRTEESLLALIDDIKNESDAKIVRRAMQLLDQFAKYLTPGQKLIMLDFLYGLLILHEEDLRRQAAEIMGRIIASFDDPYSKYLPPHVEQGVYKLSKSSVLRRMITSFLSPENVRSKLKEQWIGSALSDLFRVVITQAKERLHTVDLMLEKLQALHDNKRIYLFEALSHLPGIDLRLDQINILCNELDKSISGNHEETAIYAKICLDHLIATDNQQLIQLARRVIAMPVDSIHHNHLRYQLAQSLLTAGHIKENPYSPVDRLSPQALSAMYLSNLKSATAQSIKAINIAVLLKIMRADQTADRFYASVHLCNLIKNSEHFEIRIIAGRALLELVDLLTPEKVNEVVIELLRGLEIENYQFTKNIPPILGALIIKLSQREALEIIDDLEVKILRGSSDLKSLVVDTACHAMNSLVAKEDYDQTLMKRLQRIVFKALVQREDIVHLVAFNGLMGTVMSNATTSLQQKQRIYNDMAKKALSIIASDEKLAKHQAIQYAYGYNKLYAFLVNYQHEVGQMNSCSILPIAFFNGTFDPFSLGQKRVAMAIRDHGYEVYIHIDHFNWKRRTQPLQLRRRLIELTIADELGIYLMPTLPNFNLAVKEDGKRLKSVFNGRDVYVVAGEDMLVNHHLYSHHFDGVGNLNHLIISRENLNDNQRTTVEQRLSQIDNWQRIAIDDELSRITSEQIRHAIDQRWDLSDVMDELAAKTIYQYNMYRNEPTYKANVDTTSMTIIENGNIDHALRAAVRDHFNIEIEDYLNRAGKRSQLLVLKDTRQDCLLGVAVYRDLGEDCFNKLQSHRTVRTHYIELFKENTIVIDLMVAQTETPLHYPLLTLHSEIVVHALNNGYEYCIVKAKSGTLNQATLKLLTMTGYRPLENINVMIATIKQPVVVLFDAQSMLKTEFRSDESIRNSLTKARSELMHALVKKHQFATILAFDRAMLYNRINQIVSEQNQPVAERDYGPMMCVPYGDIYNRWVLPHSITKSLHTERVYNEQLDYYEVIESPHYPNIEQQAGIIKSFKRPVILIDDLLDKGLRLQSLEKYFKNAQIQIAHVVIGILSSTGKYRAQKKGYDVLAGYYIPNMRAWYSESQVYPFIGGDAYDCGDRQLQDVLPSVNRIMPYMSQIQSAEDSHDVVAFSDVCLKQAANLLEVIETRYHSIYRRPLTISRLNEVFVTPRIPFYGKYGQYREDIKPSQILADDLNRLRQLKQLF